MKEIGKTIVNAPVLQHCIALFTGSLLRGMTGLNVTKYICVKQCIQSSFDSSDDVNVSYLDIHTFLVTMHKYLKT